MMRLHNRYSYGQLFCYSGLDGETSRRDDFVAMMMDEPITLRFHFVEAVTLRIPLENKAKFQHITGDIMRSGDCFIAFYDRNTIVGKAPVKPLIYTEGTNRAVASGNTDKISTNFATFYLTTEERNGSV